jgi:hypothetical protein
VGALDAKRAAVARAPCRHVGACVGISAVDTKRRQAVSATDCDRFELDARARTRRIRLWQPSRIEFADGGAVGPGGCNDVSWRVADRSRPQKCLTPLLT